MTWNTWSGSDAVGTGTYELDGCNPNCAAGPLYHVPAVVTLSNPVKACSSSGTRWFWTRATFRFPGGLLKALQGESAPRNPWVFSPWSPRPSTAALASYLVRDRLEAQGELGG